MKSLCHTRQRGPRERGSRQRKKPSHTPGRKLAREKCTPERRANQRKVEERVKHAATRKEKAGYRSSKARDAPERGPHAGKGAKPQATARTTLRGNAREEGTRETDEGRQHHTPWHQGTDKPHHATTSTQTPHTHHTHHTHPRPATRLTDGRYTHVHTPAPTASERRAVAARPRDGQPEEGERLAPGAPSQRRGAPCPPPRDALLPLPQHTTRARKSARSGAGVGSPRQHHPRPGNTGNGAMAACPKGRAARGRDSSKHRTPLRWVEGHHPWTAPHHSRGKQPLAGHASQRDSAGPPHLHTRAQSTWAADPDSPPRGRAARGGRAPDLRCPSQRRKATPPGDALPPTPERATLARKSLRCGAGAGSSMPTPPVPGTHGQWVHIARTEGRTAGGGTVPDTTPLAPTPPQGMHAK